ncbi:MAG: M48 family metallopeptidase [Elusimicrobia bacterium]|nr:M48 family metallopeptidase [Elusimicrobiota bacterium]
MGISSVDRKWLGSLRVMPSLESSEYEYSADREALAAFQSIPGADWLMKKWLEFWLEFDRAALLGSTVRVSERQFPEVHAHLARAAEVLGMNPPPLFIIERPDVNAFTLGTDDENSFLLVTRKLLEVVNDRELTFILGHELGHVKSQHVLYVTLATYLANAGVFAGRRLFGALLLAYPLRMALLAWYRRSEITCDRAGLLCCQDVEAARKALLICGCGSREFADRIDLAEFAKQAEDVRNTYGKWSELFVTHPYLPKRVRSLELFAESHFYLRRVLGEKKGRFLDPTDLDEAVSNLLGDREPTIEKVEESADAGRFRVSMALAGAWLAGDLSPAQRKSLGLLLAGAGLDAETARRLNGHLDAPLRMTQAVKEAKYFDGEKIQGLAHALSAYFAGVKAVGGRAVEALISLGEASGLSKPDAERALYDLPFRKRLLRERCGLDYCARCSSLFGKDLASCPDCSTPASSLKQPEHKTVRTFEEKVGQAAESARGVAAGVGGALLSLAADAASSLADKLDAAASKPGKGSRVRPARRRRKPKDA